MNKHLHTLLLLLSLTLGMQAQTLWQPKVTMSWADNGRQDTMLTVWRGQRIALQATAVMDTIPDEGLILRGRGRSGISTETGILADVITDDFLSCGQHPADLPSYTVPDRIDTDSILEITPHREAPLWCSVEVPRDIRPGRHYVEMSLVGEMSGRPYGYLGLYLNVLEHTLPAPHDYAFHLDFWQQPYSISRYYDLEEWSDEHFRALRPYMMRLARAGQKATTAILFYEPWGDQSFDKFSPMVQTTLRRDSTWHFDYRIFDRWIEFMDKCGIDRQIDCYSMVPWDMSFRYRDEATGQYAHLRANTHEAAYDSLWTHFLRDFAHHLRSKGWFSRTCIAMDERRMDDMLRAYRIAQKAVPGMKFTLAGNYHSELSPILHDYSIGFRQQVPADTLTLRRERGQHTTFYTCCSQPSPNIFTSSHPLEATCLPLHAVSLGLDGYLHWSWINWAEDPSHDSRYRLFPPGDTYCIYPGNQPSRRWERFVEGVQMAEKIRLLRQKYEKTIASDDTLVTDSMRLTAMDHLDAITLALDFFRQGEATDPEAIRQHIEALRKELDY